MGKMFSNLYLEHYDCWKIETLWYDVRLLNCSSNRLHLPFYTTSNDQVYLLPFDFFADSILVAWSNVYSPMFFINSSPGGYMKSSAKVIADSIENLSKQRLIDTESSPDRM